MTWTNVSTLMRAGVLAVSVLLLPCTTPPFAQTTNPTPETRRMETPDDDDNTGLWGLLGLTGLIGLAGLRRRPEKVGAYDARERSRP